MDHFKYCFKPPAFKRQPIEEEAIPLPSEDKTPPVTKIYLATVSSIISRLTLSKS